MKFAVLKETLPQESRVVLVPETIKTLIKKGHQVFVEKEAGVGSFVLDSDYETAGATILNDKKALLEQAQCILRIHPPTLVELDSFTNGRALISLLYPFRNKELVDKLKEKKLTSFALELIPRISRAQGMDVLSSMSTVAGYKAVLLVTQYLSKFFPMLTTAAGTIRPAQGFIIGAGVAGLQAIATARRLGAIIEAFDTRPAVKEQVQSLGAKFVEHPQTAKLNTTELEDKSGYAKEQSKEFLEQEHMLIAEHTKQADFVITTALIPGKKAPCLITEEMALSMRPGSVIVDLAAEAGGNCQLSKANEVVIKNHVTILAPTNLPATLPLDASRMFSRNCGTFIQQISTDKDFTFNWDDEVFSETCITVNGELKNKRLLSL